MPSSQHSVLRRRTDNLVNLGRGRGPARLTFGRSRPLAGRTWPGGKARSGWAVRLPGLRNVRRSRLPGHAPVFSRWSGRFASDLGPA